MINSNTMDSMIPSILLNVDEMHGLVIQLINFNNIKDDEIADLKVSSNYDDNDHHTVSII